MANLVKEAANVQMALRVKQQPRKPKRQRENFMTTCEVVDFTNCYLDGIKKIQKIFYRSQIRLKFTVPQIVLEDKSLTEEGEPN